MSNGKVRIYELSRELNLDNKDILTFCEKLDIAVKSHSSTITEDEAERIRATARNSAVPSSSELGSSTSAKPKKPQPTNPSISSNKPEILTVKPQPRPSHSPRVVSPSKPEPQSSEAPPTTDRTEQLPSLHKPVKPNIENLTGNGSLSRPASPPEVKPQRSTPPPLEPSPSNSVPETEEEPALLAPPIRPSASPVAPRESGDAEPKFNRPIIRKSKKSEPPSSKPSDSEEKVPSPTPKRKAIEPSTEAKSGKSGVVSPPLPAKPKPVPELQRPRPQQIVRVNAATPEATEDLEQEETSKDVTEELTLKPKPSRAPNKRLPKRRKEEEEEVVEFPDKGKGASTKPKRRLKPIDDDDDDLDSELNDEEFAPVQVSLSIARPPKPARSTASKPGGISGSSKPSRKPAASGESSSTRTNRLRRRDRNVKTERPETLVLGGNMTVQELAEALIVPETEIVKRLFLKGMAVNVTQTLDEPTVTLVAEEFGVTVETAEVESEARKSTEMLDAADLENLQSRPPVVTIMGHVDHGKTTLLDTIRQAKVAQGEAGGITQHTGAYHVDVERDGQMKQIVFLDTPGHEAFTAMRARGARVTDIAVLVVAADDGVQPQTIEAISHAKAAEVPIVVAVNKIDKEEAQSDRVKQELTEYGLVPEEWGGETIMVPVSAIKGENINTLLEMLLLVAELEELSANPDRPAKGTVIEAHLDKARGPVATLLIQNGTLRVGDVLVAGSVFGKVRAMVDDRSERVEEATPSFAVEVLGMSDVPAAGDEFEVYLNEKEARSIADQRTQEQRQSRLRSAMSSRRVTLNSLSEARREGELKELNLVLKADVQGSLEAIIGSLAQLPQDEVQLRVLLAAPGEITETDVDLAAASEAVIIGFNTTLASGARQAAENEGVDVREYSVIYRLLDDIQGAMEGLLEPELVEEALGQVEVRAVFPVGRGSVAGCYVQSGQVIRNCRVRVLRGGKVIYEGILDSLKRMKEDAKEVNSGYECGIGLNSFNNWQEGDIISAYRMVTKRRTLASR